MVSAPGAGVRGVQGEATGLWVQLSAIWVLSHRGSLLRFHGLAPSLLIVLTSFLNSLLSGSPQHLPPFSQSPPCSFSTPSFLPQEVTRPSQAPLSPRFVQPGVIKIKPPAQHLDTMTALYSGKMTRVHMVHTDADYRWPGYRPFIVTSVCGVFGLSPA